MSTRVQGVFAPTRNDRIGFVWELMTRDTREGKLYEKKRRWTIFFNQPHGIAEGSFVAIESEWIDAVIATKVDEQGNKVTDTWTDANGVEQPNIEYQMRAPEIKLVKERDEKPTENRDLDDLAKYGNAPF